MSRKDKPWAPTSGMWNSGTCRAWQPATDIYRTSEGWVVKFDLAGVAPDDLTVKIVGHTLVVTGTRRDRTLREGVWHYQMEITYSRFERTIELPCDLAHAEARTEYDNGLLTITFLEDRRGEEARANE
jgi:HSP20 family protein